MPDMKVFLTVRPLWRSDLRVLVHDRQMSAQIYVHDNASVSTVMDSGTEFIENRKFIGDNH